ncbi:MAG: S9 family peptidase [Planctomycetaceae bacterium]|nr:S9 family peptidase [Planctomycetaceae bacterium]
MRWSLAALILSGCVINVVGCNPAETPPPPPKVTLPITAPVESIPAPKTPATDSKAPAAAPAPTAPTSSAQPATPATPNPMPTTNPAPAAAAPMKTPAYLANVPLISRQVLFGNPDKAAVRSSPDGKRISYLASVNNVMNVFVGPIDDPAAAKPVTKDTKRGIRSYFWAYSNQHILYVQDNEGDENFHVYATNIDTLETRDLTPFKKVAAQIEGVSHKFPNELLLGLNDRDEQFHDLYRLNLTTGERTLVAKNDQNLLGFVTDDDYRVRFAMKYGPTGGRELLEADGMGGFKPFAQIPMEDDLTTSPAGFDKTGDILYMLDSRGRNTAALTSYDLKTKETKVVAANDKADVGGVLSHPTEHTVEAVSFNYTREEWQILDEKIRPEIEYLRTVDPGELQVANRTLDDKLWIVAFLRDDGPVKYYRYERGSKQAQYLFSNRKDLDGLPLVKMHPVVIKSRDGLDLVSYLSLPKNTDPGDKGRPSQPLAMVLDVHGGPWARDDWGYNPVHQMLANRGYAVLSVNFRGSTGFGKSFINAGNREWAGKMHDDLLDAVNWSIEQKIADPKQIAIMGGSYGGYATLVGLTFTPDVFACGVDIVGPSNIITLLNTIPPYWQPAIQMFKDRVGDHTTPEGKKFLDDRSPLTHVGKIVKPLLIAQGANDPRVKQSEADQIVKAMQDKRIPVTYVLYPDEGHGFARPENRMSFNAVTEAFLAQHLGGRYEPIGNDFTGSTIQIPNGADGVPGLPAGTTK